MSRRYRRRPPHWVTLAFVAALVIVARVAQVHFSPPRDRPGAPPPALEEGDYRVERAVDGDTIIVLADGRRQRVRLIGIDTPEVFQRGTGRRLQPPEPYAAEASAFTKDFIAGGRVRLRFGRNRLDKYDRLRAYVFVDEKMLNEELVRAGLAKVDLFPGDESSLTTRLKRAQREAQAAGRGLWGAK